MIESIKIINNDNSFTVYYKDKYAKELGWMKCQVQLLV